MILVTTDNLSDAAWLALMEASDAAARAAFPDPQLPDELDAGDGEAVVVSRRPGEMTQAQGGAQ